MNHHAPSDMMNRYHELLTLMEGDHDLLHELIDVFLEDAPERMAAVRQALGAGDAVALYKAAHTLKGSAGNFGATEVVSRALQLEAHARCGDLVSASMEVPLLEADMDRLTSELVEVCRK